MGKWMIGRSVALAAAAATFAATAATPAATRAVSNGFKVLHAFAGDDGAEGFGSYATLVQASDGSFYGTTFYGGPEAFRCNCSVGGTVFRMTAAGAITVLHTFMSTDGASPAGGLALGPDGAFYGTTYGGGDYGLGVAFRIDASGTLSVLHSFGGPAGEGASPYLGALALGPDGSFYGTTSRGGASGHGTLFRMTPSGQVTVLHAFAGGAADGATPRGGVAFASDGNLYGTTLCGGAGERPGTCGGIVYSWSAGSGFKLLHSFDPIAGVHDGFGPQSALTERSGFLYGTTSLGGDGGAGTVFKMKLGGKGFVTVHTFSGGVAATPPNADGKAPVGRLALGKDGKLYGTTSNGGSYRSVHPEGDGMIFSLDKQDAYAQLLSFGQTLDNGAHPLAGLALGTDGTLYGLTESGNANYTGVFYSYLPPKAPK